MSKGRDAGAGKLGGAAHVVGKAPLLNEIIMGTASRAQDGSNHTLD
jgi:hypothetical protein